MNDSDQSIIEHLIDNKSLVKIMIMIFTCMLWKKKNTIGNIDSNTHYNLPESVLFLSTPSDFYVNVRQYPIPYFI